MNPDELNLDELEKDINNKNAVEDKFKDILKHKKAAEDKAETLAKEKAESDAKLSNLEKETSFLNTFTENIGKYPAAPEYKDKIKEKVLSGYSFDDAAISVLVAEGKYTPAPPPRENAAGGSAPNQITNNSSQKSPGEMTNSEKWEALREAERKGEIGLS